MYNFYYYPPFNMGRFRLDRVPNSLLIGTPIVLLDDNNVRGSFVA
jgi:hypothetical protein